MARSVKSNEGTTLVEALVAAALGIIVIGGGVLMYNQGNKAFNTTTEHASFRGEALLVLETIDRDLKGLVVSKDVNPRTKFHYMVQPYELADPVEQAAKDPTGKLVKKSIATSVSFHRYHRTEMEQDGEDTKAMVIGQRITYKAVLIDPSKPERGMNLLRNGKRVNKIPLAGILFEPIDPIMAADTIGASPAAVLKVTIVPRGGVFGGLTPDVIDRLRLDGKVATRVFHLSGYESQFTTILWMALAKSRAKLPPDDLEKEVLTWSDKNLPKAFRENVSKNLKEIFDLGYKLDQGRVRLEDTEWNDATAGVDKVFAEAKVEEGLPESYSGGANDGTVGKRSGGAGFGVGAGSSTSSIGL